MRVPLLTAALALTTVASVPAETTRPTEDAATPLASGLPARGQWRQGFSLADVDGDGDLDLVHGPPRAGDATPRLFLNDGRGRFARWSAARFTASSRLDYGDAEAADFDGDGRIDLALGAHLLGIGVLGGDGAGGFTPAANAPAWSGDAAFATVALEAVDWDADGRIDLVALAEGPRPSAESRYGLLLLRNLGDRWVPLAGEDPGRLFGDGLAVGDLDGDGRPDAAAAARSVSHRGHLFLGRGADGWSLAVAPRRERAYIFAVALCDLDGDGRDELAEGFFERQGEEWRSGVDVLDLDPDGGWTRRLVLAGDGDDPPRALVCGPTPGDPHPDLVVGTSRGRLTLLPGDGRGGFDEPLPVASRASNGGCGVRSLALADLDGDGSAELIGSLAATEERGCARGGALRAWRLGSRRQ